MKPKPERIVVSVEFWAEGTARSHTLGQKNIVSFCSPYEQPGKVSDACDMEIHGLEADGMVFTGIQNFDASGYTPGGAIALREHVGKFPPTETQFDILWHKLRDLRSAALDTLTELREYL